MPLNPNVNFANPHRIVQLGFDILLRGLRADVRPNLRRRALQAISTLIDNDASLAPCLLGIDPDNPPTEPAPPEDVINNSNHDILWESSTTTTPATTTTSTTVTTTIYKTSASADGSISEPASKAAASIGGRFRSRVRRKLRGATAGISDDGSSGRSSDPVQDVLLDRITDILGLHSAGPSGFCNNGVGNEGGGRGPATAAARGGSIGIGISEDGVWETDASARGRGGEGGVAGADSRIAARAIRTLVDLLPLPGLRPSSLPSAVVSASARAPAAVVRAAAAASAATGRVITAAGGGKLASTGEDDRDWWEDEVHWRRVGRRGAAVLGITRLLT